MINPQEIDSVLISLKVAENQVLFMLLSTDGTINRMGNGSADCTDTDLFIGQTGTLPMIVQLRSMITKDMLEYLHKTFDVPEKKGRRSELKILLKGPDFETGVEFHYGEHSQGPPKEFANLVRTAVQLTTPWQTAQRKGVSQAAQSQPKPWWKFW